jgi:cobalamin biosynthesis Co2+ chelatase CbiK
MKLFLLALLFPLAALAQNPHEATIVKQANELAQAFPKKDYTTLARYTHPNLLKVMGGKERMIQQLKQQIAIMDKQGVRFGEVSVGRPSAVVQAGNELQCTIPQTITIQTPQQKIKQASTLLAFSNDGGRQWVFVDTQPGIDQIRKVIPSVSHKLTIPARQAPQVIK